MASSSQLIEVTIIHGGCCAWQTRGKNQTSVCDGRGEEGRRRREEGGGQEGHWHWHRQTAQVLTSQNIHCGERCLPRDLGLDRAGGMPCLLQNVADVGASPHSWRAIAWNISVHCSHMRTHTHTHTHARTHAHTRMQKKTLGQSQRQEYKTKHSKSISFWLHWYYAKSLWVFILSSHLQSLTSILHARCQAWTFRWASAKDRCTSTCII